MSSHSQPKGRRRDPDDDSGDDAHLRRLRPDDCDDDDDEEPPRQLPRGSPPDDDEGARYRRSRHHDENDDDDDEDEDDACAAPGPSRRLGRTRRTKLYDVDEDDDEDTDPHVETVEPEERKDEERSGAILIPLRATSRPPDAAYSLLRSLHPSITLRSDLGQLTGSVDPLEKLIVIMVGLPARGKTYIAKKLRRFLAWSGAKTKVFNVGNVRRSLAAGVHQDASYFSADPERTHARDAVAIDVLDNLIAWLRDSGGHVGIHDATNSTRARRMLLLEHIARAGLGKNVLLVESICTDPEVIERNIAMKRFSPDYISATMEEMQKDFGDRLRHYEKRYVSLGKEDEATPFVKIINVGRQVIVNRIAGHLPSQVVTFLLNFHIGPRSVWICRHGETTANRDNLIGGDGTLSDNGLLFADALAAFFDFHKAEIGPIQVWTSNLGRTVQTAEALSRRGGYLTRQVPALNELNAGKCDGMTYEELQRDMPKVWRAREKDKLAYRYPGGGESYLDLIQRTKIVGHRAVNRVIVGYFLDVPRPDIPYMQLPLHSLTRLTPTPFGCEEEVFMFDLAAFARAEPVFWSSVHRAHSFRRMENHTPPLRHED